MYGESPEEKVTKEFTTADVVVQVQKFRFCMIMILRQVCSKQY